MIVAETKETVTSQLYPNKIFLKKTQNFGHFSHWEVWENKEKSEVDQPG